MYLSKVNVPWKFSKNPYELHRALWKLFPGREDESRDFIFRVENLQTGIGVEVLMQSMNAPIASDNETSTLKISKAFELNVLDGQRFRFRLRANPIKTIKDPSRKKRLRNGKEYEHGVRVPLIDEDQQLEWLERKLKAVASLESVVVRNESSLYFHKSRGNHGGKIQTVCFDGILVVDEKDGFIQLCKQGIGPAKSFGCGLLSLAPI